MQVLGIAGLGFAASLSLIVAIGAQNAFVLRQGIKGQHVFWVCLTCGLLDALLIVAGVGGFHVLVAQWPWLTQAACVAGAAFLFWYGWRNARAAWQGTSALALGQADDAPVSLLRTVLVCMALTLLNPHVYLDTVVLLGALSAQFGQQAWVFGCGAVLASFTFFFALGYGAALLRPVLTTPAAWRVLDALIAVTMWAIGLGLLVQTLPALPV